MILLDDGLDPLLDLGQDRGEVAGELSFCNANRRHGFDHSLPAPVRVLRGVYEVMEAIPLAIIMVYAIKDGMTLKVDPAGRIVLPKPLRERLGLRAGAEIELTEAPEGLLLRPVQQRPSLVRRGPFLIHQGAPPPGFDPVRAVEEGREVRLRSLLSRQ